MADEKNSLRNLLDTQNISDIKKVKEYLNKNPMATVMDVMQETGVSSVQIKKFVDAGVLKIRNAKR
jgi:hypothetical protein